MSHCPVCQVRYVQSQTVCCPVCGWDVQPLTLLIGLIPEVAEKEAIRLEWAQKLWHSVQVQRKKVHQLQTQLKEAIELSQHIQPPLLVAALDHPVLDHSALTEPLRYLESDANSSLSHPVEQVTQEQVTQEQTSPVCIESAATVDTPRPELALVGLSPVKELPPDDAILESFALQSPIFLSTKSPNPDIPAERDTATIAVASPSTQMSLQEFSFDVVMLGEQGTERRQHNAFCFQQSLEMGLDLEMVLVPGGKFWMGSPESEIDRDSHESPYHEVTLAPFCLSKFPITQVQWRTIAALPKIRRSLSFYPSTFEIADRPVEQVSWYDAIEFCARLSQHTGQLYRLPSEAEWEYACRANTNTPFHFGETLLPDWANYDGNYIYGPGRLGFYRQETTPVGTFETANAFGLYDMHGNIWEWCADPWHDNYHDAPTDGSLWKSDDDGNNYQVLRGGAWYCLPSLCRSAQRHWNQPDVGGSGIGFRVACVVS